MFFWFLVFGLLGYMVVYCIYYNWEYSDTNEFDKKARKEALNNIKQRSLDKYYVFTPINIRGLTLRNRVIKSGTFESACKDGLVSKQLIDFHTEQAKEVGMVTVSYGCVSPEGRTFANQLLINEDAMDGLKMLTKSVHETGSKISIQLTHAGMMSEPVYDKYNAHTLYSASKIWSWGGLQFTTELSIENIQELVEKFGKAAKICQECNFDAVTVHCGHGYLISQFLSPLTNFRTDKYGKQSIESRAQFAVEIIKRIRHYVGESFPILIKINSHDGVKGGLSVDDSAKICQILIDNGGDVIIPSAGFILKNGIYMMRGKVPMINMVLKAKSWIKRIGISLVGPFLIPNIKFKSMYLLDTSLSLLNKIFKKDNNNKCKGIFCYIGGITNLNDMNKALAAGFELIAISRAVLREPDFLGKIKQDSGYQSKCDHKNECIIAQMSSEPLYCIKRTDIKKSQDIEDLH